MASETALKAREENAVRKLLDLAQDVEDWNNPRELDRFVWEEKAFGQKGDNLLHILIQRENPTTEMGRKTRRDPNNVRRERNNTLWMDAPSESATLPSVAPGPNAAPFPIITTFAREHPDPSPRRLRPDSDVPRRQQEPPPAVASSNKTKAVDYDWIRKKSHVRSTRDSDLRDRDTSQSDARTTVDKGTDAGIGRNLLIWMLRHRLFYNYFVSLPSAPDGRSPDQEKLPVHLAIFKGNLAFLACFLGLFCDPKAGKQRPSLHKILEREDRSTKENCVHFAIYHAIPFASSFVAVCSTAALLKTDRENFTPMHRAMERKKEGRAWIPPKPASFATHATQPVWDDTFDPARIFDEVLRRSKSEKQSNLMAKILTKVNNVGVSPLQSRLGVENVSDNNMLADRLKAAVFDNVDSITEVGTALYGTSDNTKELYLNMTDFNQAGLNFESFVDKLTDQPRRDDDAIAFEDTLFFVHLPDLNYVKQPCPHGTIRKLFTWLRSRGVRTIKMLRIPDSTTTPLSDAFVQKYVFDVFRIESLDWRKLDINLGALSYSTGDAPSANERRKTSALTDLKLYSSGNWSVLYHWMSKDGLAVLPKLRSVRIDIIHLDPAPGVYDQATHSRHSDLANTYKKRMDDEFQKAAQRAENPLPFIPDIRTDVTWDYPLPSHEPEDTATQTVKHQFTNQLQPTFSALRVLGDQREFTVNLNGYDDLDESSNLERAHNVAFAPRDDVRSDGRYEDHSDDRYNDHDDDRYDDRYNERYDDRYDERYDDRYDNRSSYRGDYPRRCNDDGNDDTNGNSRWKRERKRFQEYALGPMEVGRSLDKRIRVAILDNGADRIRSRFRDMIAKGQSYVTTDELHANQPLPWWMVSDPHGTQMASLISQVNQYCRLYIARVGTLRNDIRADSAASAIRWAIKHNVDVISISWTLRQSDPDLQKAISEAAQKRILIFCSTPDEGMYSEAWPVGYTDHVISVSATDRFGHLTSKSRTANPADVLIPGENLRAAGPAYIGNVSSSVSGSSVATALAAGIASLALVLLQTFNNDAALWESDSDATSQRHSYYTRDGMLKVFRRMGPKEKAVLLSKMFPQDARDEHAALETLAKLWRVSEW